MIALLVSITVGPDRPRGEVQARPTVNNLDGLPRVQRRFERFGVRPTWLLAWPVAARKEGDLFADAWAEDRGEVGVCLQPWCTPPFEANEDRLAAHPPSALPAAAVEAKLGALTDRIIERFGRAPRCHRAAGGGLDGALLQALERRGYLADLSVTPLVDGRARGGVDWRGAPSVPYFPDRQRPMARGDSPVLEIPVTAGFERAMPASVARALVGLPASARRLIARGGLRPRVLDPVRFDAAALCRLAEAEVARGVPCLHLAMASRALHPGCSVVAPSPADVEAILDRLDAFLRFAVDTLRVQPETVSGFLTRHLALDPAAAA